MDYNRALKNRVVKKIETLDKKNGGDIKKTMQDFMAWARKGTEEITTTTKRGDTFETSVAKEITLNGMKGKGWCLVVFDMDGYVLEYRY